MNDMNTDVLQDKAPRYEKLAKPRKRIDRNINYNAFNVRPGTLSYQITDTLNKLAQPKRSPEPKTPVAADSSIKSVPAAATVKYGAHRLINSDEQSKDAQESRKRNFPLNTYARIVAARNKRFPRHSQDLTKPKNYSSRPESYEDYDDFRKMKNPNTKPILRFPKQDTA
nr:uncharacterized protein LOC116426831 [Nomia melanderi]